MKIIIEGKFDSKWKTITEIPLPVPIPKAPPAQEFRAVVKGPFGIKATLIGRVRFEVG